MSIARLAVILASAACFVPSGATPSPIGPLKSPVADVAGDYFFGNGLGSNFSLGIEPEGRFLFCWKGCLGLNDENSGEAKVEAGHLILKPERPTMSGKFQAMDTDLIPVRWGERLYLIPEAKRREFCDLVNQGKEPRAGALGRVYLREGDWEKKVTGLPSVPKEWDPLLAKKPLQGG